MQKICRKGLHSYDSDRRCCPECKKIRNKKYYYSDIYRVRKTTKKYINERRNYIRDKKTDPCTDCGERYPWYVMDFDHLRDKVQNVTTMLTRSFSEIDIEISKCDLVCSNCHRIRTHFRAVEKGERTP